MFDIGISELAVIAVVALVVLGPERLPKAARTLGHLLGRARRYVEQVKTDVSRELELEELRRMRSDVQTAMHDVENTIHRELSQVEEQIHGLADSVREASGLTHDTATDPFADHDATVLPSIVPHPAPPAVQQAAINRAHSRPPHPAPPLPQESHRE